MGKWCILTACVAGCIWCFGAHAASGGFPDAPPLYYDLKSMPENGAGANVFLPGERTLVRVPPGAADKARSFEVRDDLGRVVRSGESGSGVDLRGLGTGWYRIDFLEGPARFIGWTTAAILPPLPKRRGEDTPVAVDVALCWTASDTDRDRTRMADLAKRAGVTWVRDRLRWREIEPEPGKAAPPTKYDRMASLQHRLGMDVLQVFHDMPAALRPAQKPGEDRELPDLRAVHAFCGTLARRFHGSVRAWEPWNEANCGSFGAWPPHLMCAWQKAAWLGFKKADAKLPVCWMPIAGINTPSLARSVVLNETWPYFDLYSIHSYDWNMGYADLWRHARDAASGRPVWVTESDRGIHAEKDAEGGELSSALALLKAQFIAQSYADSLAAGALRHFHFILGQYMETTVQFGLLRKDMTPRPGYVALAATARALRGTRCIGSLSPKDTPGARMVAFRGKKRDVLVKWVENSGEWETRGRQQAPMPRFDGVPTGRHTDYLGRRVTAPEVLLGAPVFEELPAGACDPLPLAPVPRSEWRDGAPCPVVLQADLPRAEVRLFKPEWTEEYDYVLPSGGETPLAVWVYNFSREAVRGDIHEFMLPGGWTVTPLDGPVEVAPGERARLNFTLKTTDFCREPAAEFWPQLHGDFGAAGKPVAAFRVRILNPNGDIQ